VTAEKPLLHYRWAGKKNKGEKGGKKHLSTQTRNVRRQLREEILGGKLLKA